MTSRQKVQYGTSSDYSEGLMGEIQRLIAPPSEEYKKKPPNPFKRAGKSNHDTCDSCSEAGNLICCDYCTASFHLSCHDPPITEEDIPSGLWLCHTCTMKEKYAKEDEQKQKDRDMAAATKDLKQKEEEPTSTTESTTSMDIGTSRIANEKEGLDAPDSAIEVENQAKLDEIAEDIEMSKENTPADNKQELSPFEQLVRAASLLNPRQFELPVEMRESFPFPGSERVEPMRNGRRVKNKRLVELDALGCVPLPAKLCFTCNKSCKRAPLISCDYCSLYFHQDCLDPPMCALPSGRWMCPNHPQHFIDWNLVNTLSATERMKLWNQHAIEPIDHEVVKLQFFRKVHMKNPPFRTKLKPKRIDEVEVPDIVRYHYENPPTLLPSLKQVMRIDALKKRGTVPVDSQKIQIDEIDSQLEAINAARKKLKTIFNDQEDIHKILEESEEEEMGDESVEKSPSKSPTSKRSKRSKNDTKEVDSTNETEIKKEISDCGDSTDHAKEEEEVKNVHSENIEIKIETDSMAKDSILSASELQSVNEQLENLDMSTIKLLAFQRLQQIVNENPNQIQKFQDKSTASSLIAEIAKWDTNRFPIPQPTENKESEEDKKDENSGNVSTNNVSIRMRDRPFHIRSDEEKASSLALSLEYPIHRSKVRSRAVLTFANDYLSGRVWFTVKPSLNQSVFMRYRSFDIGIGADNHLDLSRFGVCAFASTKHAVIFFDEITKQFELLNYSEFGTEVNGQVYTCDFTEHPQEVTESPSSPLKDKRVAIQSKIKNMLDAKKKIREGIDKGVNENEGDAIMADEESPYCECKGRHPMNLAAWEGTALLQHGYLLKFGCLSFVFSIVENIEDENA